MQADDFLVKDYELKVNYLSGHFGRMWIRFNFFLTIHSGLLAVLLAADRSAWGDKSLYFTLVGALFAWLWWWFGAEDRALVQIYRSAVRKAASRITVAIKDLPSDYNADTDFVGETDLATEKVGLHRFRPFGWRSNWMSITRLAALFPLVIVVLWTTAFLLLPLPQAVNHFSIRVLRRVLGLAQLSIAVTLTLGFLRARQELFALRRPPSEKTPGRASEVGARESSGSPLGAFYEG
jgi:hypothetical protein